MGALKAGLIIAAAVAGPSLYPLVRSGSLDTTQAVERGAVVAVAVAVGASFVERLIDSYRRTGPVPRPPGYHGGRPADAHHDAGHPGEEHHVGEQGHNAGGPG